MKRKILAISIILILLVGFVFIKQHVQTTSNVKEVNNAEAMNSGDFAENFNFSIDKLKIDGFKKEWTLVGVDGNGYYFSSNENDNQVLFYYYDKLLNSTKSVVMNIGNSIYNTYFYEEKMYIVMKETDSQPNGGVVSIIKIDIKSDTSETIYEDNGKMFPEYYFYENKVLLANVYDEEKAEAYKITSINLDNNASKILKTVRNNNTDNQNREEILRIGGSEDFLYSEVEKIVSEDQNKDYFLRTYDLKSGRSGTINLNEPIDFISGDKNLFVSRTYATAKPISNSAISFNQYNQQSDAYDKHVIYNTDSTNHPYALYKIGDYHVLLLTFDIIVVDMKNLSSDTINYRSKIESENVSPPFVIDNKIYYMKKSILNENYYAEIYICEI